MRENPYAAYVFGIFVSMLSDVFILMNTTCFFYPTVQSLSKIREHGYSFFVALSGVQMATLGVNGMTAFGVNGGSAVVDVNGMPPSM